MSGDRLRVRFSPFAICNRGNLSGIDRGYADPVIVHEYVPENDALHLTLRQLVADFSFFKVAKAFHSRIVKAISGTAEDLNKPCLPKHGSECFSGMLTSPRSL